MRFALEGLDEGIVTFDPVGLEPEPVEVRCGALEPPVPRCMATLFFIVGLEKKPA